MGRGRQRVPSELVDGVLAQMLDHVPAGKARRRGQCRIEHYISSRNYYRSICRLQQGGRRAIYFSVSSLLCSTWRFRSLHYSQNPYAQRCFPVGALPTMAPLVWGSPLNLFVGTNFGDVGTQMVHVACYVLFGPILPKGPRPARPPLPFSLHDSQRHVCLCPG